MLLEALQIVENSLRTYLEQRLGTGPGTMVCLGNVAMADQNNDLDDKLIISLVNIEEESSLKNARTVRSSALTGGSTYHNAPVSLNLYLLFSANFANNYDNALRILSLVLEFFQGQRTFTSPPSTDPDRLNARAELSFNLYTMTFEQLNHLWGALGGKQLPSALYRVYLVQLEDERIQGGGRLIEDVTGNVETVTTL